MSLGLVALGLVWASPALTQETERVYLSGTGFGDTRDWDFRVDAGRRSGFWSTIAVPSQWELEGFGTYAYGFGSEDLHDEGEYRYRFAASPSWRGRRVMLTFEGVMTDASVRLNGHHLGPPHRGGFFPFSFDVTWALRFEESNLLEVHVRERSRDRSVNLAEREADYWVFGGIYRPVYLEISSPSSIDHVAIDARHDGRLTAAVEVRGSAVGLRLEGRVRTLEGRAVGEPLVGFFGEGESAVRLQGRFPGAAPWSAESPILYRLELRLIRGDQVVHVVRRQFGFRTVELRPGRGLFINGHRVRLRGINRHSFWPESGRTLNREINRRDAELIKEMNMNAVRASHYPPDRAFLEACDELGLYVLNEVPGWHDAYTWWAGRPLVEAMVRRDLNHPSVIAWNNGNEGGWNLSLDAEIARHDLQGRPVLHPDADFGGIDARHYPSWEELRLALDPELWRNRLRGRWGTLPLVLPTEALHGLYDGGLGSGLEDYWNLLLASPRGLGLFLWTYLDEGVVRTDRDDRGEEIDTQGSYGADGIVGPFREKEGSFDAVKEIWSPIRFPTRKLVPTFDGSLEIENRFDETNLADCRFHWRWIRFPGPGAPAGAEETLVRGEMAGPDLGPGESGRLAVPDAESAADADALAVVAEDPHGRRVIERVWPLSSRRQLAARLREPDGEGPPPVAAKRLGDSVILAAGDARIDLDAESGELRRILMGGSAIALAGPRLVGARSQAAREVRLFSDQGSAAVESPLGAGLEEMTWRLFPDGWLRLDYRFTAREGADILGVYFGIEEELVRGVRWLGEGPSRVWRNRRAGGRLGIWEKEANDTVTGESWIYPEFKGYYAGVYWAELRFPRGTLTLALASEDLFLSLFPPRSPAEPRHASASAPPGLGVLHAIPAIGTKFYPPAALGPQSAARGEAGTFHGTLWLRWRPAVSAAPAGTPGAGE